MNDRAPNDSVEAVASLDVDQATSLPAIDPAADSPALSAPPRQATLPMGTTAAAANSRPVEAAAIAGANGKPSDDPASGGTASDVTASKSQRVRDFLQQHPEAKNKAVAAALASYGVTPADVANVKSQQKRKQQEAQKGARRSRSAAEPPSPASSAAARSDDAELQFDLSLSDLERGIAFVRELGSIQRARQAIELLEQIRQIKP